MEINFGDYLISTDPTLLDKEVIFGFLSRSYWAHKRSKDTILRSLDNSICYGVYHDRRQIGFARVVTDWATVYYLCDVFIDESYRGIGIGKKLVETITQQFDGVMGLLGTKDAHGLYESFGFVRNTERFMLRRTNL